VKETIALRLFNSGANHHLPFDKFKIIFAKEIIFKITVEFPPVPEFSINSSRQSEMV